MTQSSPEPRTPMAVARSRRWRAPAFWCAAVIATITLSACGSTEQIRFEMDHSNLTLTPEDLERDGVGFLTPAAATGQEADKQALALAFAKELQSQRPEVKVVTLPEILSAVNASDLDQAYKRMYRDYRETGILDGAVLREVGEAGSVRFLAQMNLAGFQQGSRGRFSFLGLRLFDTKIASLRVFIQIWDSSTGAVAWECSGELNYAYESLAEDPAPFVTAATLAADRMFKELAPTTGKK